MSVPVTVIAAGLAVAGGVFLVAGLRRPRDSCEEVISTLATRCAELQAAEERSRVMHGHHESVDATLRTALAEPAARVPNGPLAPALQTLRREHHHARDQLAMARAAASDAQRHYDEARAAVPPSCGPCPPCGSAGSH